MDSSWEKDVVSGARRLYASALKNHKGKQQKPRMDKGVPRGHFPTSETQFLKRKRDSVREAMSSTAGEGPAQQSLEGDAALSSKALKEMQLQKHRRLDRAIDAAQNGYLLQGEDAEAAQAFAKLPNQKRKWEQQDTKRIETLALRKQLCQTVSEHHSWNWRSLGHRKVWSSSVIPAAELLPLVLVSVSWLTLMLSSFDASVFCTWRPCHSH